MKIISFSLFLVLGLNVNAQTFCDDFTLIPSYASTSSNTLQQGDTISLANGYNTVELASEDNYDGSLNSTYFISNMGSLYGITGDVLLKITPNYSFEEFAVYASNLGTEYGAVPSFILNGDSSSNQLEFHNITDFPMTVGGVDVSLDTTYIADGVINSAYKMIFDGDVSSGLVMRSSLDITFRKVCFESASLNTEELTSLKANTIYPNPTHSEVHLESSSIIESALVFDVLGNLLQTYMPISTQYDFRLNGPEGIYFIQVNTEDKLSETLKIVKH